MWSPNSVVPAFCLLLIICAATEVIGIIGGRYARLGQFPYHAILLEHDWQFGGGSLVSEFFVLTCGHCVTTFDKDICTVLLGVIDLTDTNGQMIPPQEFISHPQFNATSLDYDIGLIRLSRAAEINQFVKTIGMAFANATYSVNTVAHVSGHGEMDAYHTLPECLKYAYVPLWDKDNCTIFDRVTDHGMVCAGFDDAQNNPCPGDSGGGLVVNNIVFAVFFMDYRCGEPHYPTVYQFVPYHRQWIDQVMHSQFVRKKKNFWNSTMNAHNVRHKNFIIGTSGLSAGDAKTFNVEKLINHPNFNYESRDDKDIDIQQHSPLSAVTVS
ncbi:uncharacterized protein Dwil_GK10657 [Drosophila willistoni]|uniref:Peptidase S1 domain-containing protein n=1 Tax=Drosophila willistoni TaxID=7260 RepID=B4MIT9_DROWI|nr:trypsin-3 [Drosophila willistoni]EDW72028.2 uncharacterized protein Dwil_GK10657 [Drosophila willistoni]